MKQIQSHSKQNGKSLITVRLEFTHPSATTVCIAGTFNDWKSSPAARNPSGTGNWRQELNLKPGTYEYCLIVDGQWMPDPVARSTVPNPFGGSNSILVVASSPEAAHRADAGTLPLKNANLPQTPRL
jgi:1,4-alpha-glucan branching enzyme